MSDEIFYSQDEIDDFDDDDYEDEPEIFGYECLGCGCTFAEDEVSEGDPCPVCGAMALSPMFD